MLQIDPTIQPQLDITADYITNMIREIACDWPETNSELALNYLITRVLTDIYGGSGYGSVNDAVGVLECVKHRFLSSTSARNIT